MIVIHVPCKNSEKCGWKSSIVCTLYLEMKWNEITIFGEEATSAVAGFHGGPLYRPNLNLEMFIFVEREKPENSEKTLGASLPSNRQQTQPTYGTRLELNLL